MPEQEVAADKAASIGKGLGDIIVWLLAIVAGFAGYAGPQVGVDLVAIVNKMMVMFKLDKLFTSGTTTVTTVSTLIAGAIYASIGGTALYWGMKYDKLIGAVAKILGAHLLGRGIRLIFSGLGG